jgi:hypothetical protein
MSNADFQNAEFALACLGRAYFIWHLAFGIRVDLLGNRRIEGSWFDEESKWLTALFLGGSC